MFYYISTGSQTKMYTLRQRYEDVICGRRVVRDDYIQNLSTDVDKASEKARLIAGDHLDLGDLEPLEEIRRRDSVEVKKILAEKEAQDERLRRDRMEEHLSLIAAGVFPFGIFRNERISTCPSSYALTWIRMELTADDYSPMLILQDAIKEAFPQLINLPVPTGDYVGTIGKRQQFVATCAASFSFETYYGWSSIVKFVTDSGELLVYMGSGNVQDEIGQKYFFAAGVKSHEVYEGEPQTKITRITKMRACHI